MQIPSNLLQLILQLVENKKIQLLKNARTDTSNRYRKGVDSREVFTNEEETLSYLATRLPATFAACVKVYQAIQKALPHLTIRSLLDLGAGPGSATWAASEIFEEIIDVHLIEREPSIVEIGKQLASAMQRLNYTWKVASLDQEVEIPKVDLAVFSYSYGELDPAKGRALILKLMNQNIPVIAVIEPGTPRGFEKIISLRSFVLQMGAKLIAPCPHSMACPMSQNDWCHFSARVERSKLHRLLKEGSLGYEDEKFSYLVFSPKDLAIEKIAGRVVRSPLKGKGHVKFSLCAENGRLEPCVATRSDKNSYKMARDLEWGDSWG